MLIGGFNCQLVTAHPVVRCLQNGTYEMYVNISYGDHWALDLFGGPSTSPDCQDLCCKLHPSQLSANVSDGSVFLGTSPIVSKVPKKTLSPSKFY